MRLACSMPAQPVQALALPLLAMIARTSLPRMCSIETRTGAAFTLLVVNVAAAMVGPREKIIAMSCRPSLPGLIPQKALVATKPSGAVIPPQISSKGTLIERAHVHARRKRGKGKTIPRPLGRDGPPGRPWMVPLYNPVVSAQPHKIFKLCTACPEAPLIRLSSALSKTTRPVRGSCLHAISMKFVPRTFFVSG